MSTGVIVGIALAGVGSVLFLVLMTIAILAGLDRFADPANTVTDEIPQ